MRKELRTRAATKIVEHLIPAELVLDQALSSASKLFLASLDARIDAQLPAHCGHRAIKGMSNVIDLLAQAREELIRVHTELSQTKIQVGLGPMSYGNSGGIPTFAQENDDSVVRLAG